MGCCYINAYKKMTTSTKKKHLPHDFSITCEETEIDIARTYNF